MRNNEVHSGGGPDFSITPPYTASVALSIYMEAVRFIIDRTWAPQEPLNLTSDLYALFGAPEGLPHVPRERAKQTAARGIARVGAYLLPIEKERLKKVTPETSPIYAAVKKL